MNPNTNADNSGVNTLLLVLVLIGLTLVAAWFFMGRADLTPAASDGVNINVDTPSVLPTTPAGTTGE